VWACFIWSRNLEDNLEDNEECGPPLYGAETWRITMSVGLLYMEQKPGGQRRVWACFIWSRNLEDNADCGSTLYGAETWRTTHECGSALYGAETWRTTQNMSLLYIERKLGGQGSILVCFI
jgi:hypothetical protein